MKLTDNLQLIEPASRSTAQSPDTITLYYPARKDVGHRAYLRFSKAGVEKHRLDKYTHVLIQATRKDFVLHFSDKPAQGAHRLGKVTASGREISSAALIGALHMVRGDRFRIDFSREGATIYGSWPKELQERIDGVTQIRRAS